LSAQIGVTGLAVMGANLARNLARNGYTVALHNRSIEKTDALLEAHGDEGDFIRTESLQELVDSLEKPRRVLIMVKAGAPVDSVIEKLVPLLEAGDIVIDAGNSHYEDTRRREAALAEKDLHFVGVGVSGGEEGALPGPDAGKDRGEVRRRPVLHLDRHRRRRPLRQDGAQRHRIRRHAGHRGSL
jgi:6-phosphogluconate dehydrogenase